MARQRQPQRQYPRAARVNEVMLEVLGDGIERLSDPRLGFVTLTGVEVSPDLRVADVYYSVLGGEEQHLETERALRSASAHLRSDLGRQVRLKFLPELRFHEDPSVAHGERIESLIRDLHAREEQPRA